MLDCTTDDYDYLYQPWLFRGNLVEWAENIPTRAVVLDLCGGTGAVSRAVLERQPLATVWLLDLNPRCILPGVRLLQGRTEDARYLLAARVFDLVFCRQAIGYLNIKETFKSVAAVLVPGGKFIFNTFGKPSAFSIKTYSYEGSSYREAHVSLFGHVLHLQKRESQWDLSTFRWHSEREIETALTPWFAYERKDVGNTQYWVCTVKTIPSAVFL